MIYNYKGYELEGDNIDVEVKVVNKMALKVPLPTWLVIAVIDRCRDRHTIEVIKAIDELFQLVGITEEIDTRLFHIYYLMNN